MGEKKPFELHKFFMGIVYAYNFDRTAVLKIFENDFGVIDYVSKLQEFDVTDYYKEEMGGGLKREFVSFREPIDPYGLSAAKIRTNEIENMFSDKKTGKRKINIDPGILSLAKVMLATTKDFAHRLPLKDGIYGEVTLSFTDKSFQFNPWTYPDYKKEETIKFFNKIREEYKKDLLLKK